MVKVMNGRGADTSSGQSGVPEGVAPGGVVPVGGVRRVVSWALMWVAVVHSIAVVLYVMPPNPIREAVGAERVAGYVTPYFRQGWNVFAPTPGVGDNTLVIRARLGETVRDAGVTEWLDIDERAADRLLYNVARSRMEAVGRRMTGSMLAQLNSLSTEQREIVLASYPPSSGALADLSSRLETAVPGYDASGYLLVERRLTTLATLIARAVWGPRVSMVQFKIATHRVPAYPDREKESYATKTPQETLVGWRGAADVPAEAQRDFDDWVEGRFE